MTRPLCWVALSGCSGHLASMGQPQSFHLHLLLHRNELHWQVNRGEGMARAQWDQGGTQLNAKSFPSTHKLEDTGGKLPQTRFPRSTSLAMRAGFLTPVLREERGALTGGRWRSSRLKHSQACKLPLKSLRTWWPTPQAYGKRRKVIACQAPEQSVGY